MILDKLASSLQRRDEVPNEELAAHIAEQNDANAIKELIDNLANKNKDIQNDCIKVLYEVGERQPALICDYIPQFIALLSSKNNRLQWGGMTALATIAPAYPDRIFPELAQIVAAADSGSVITRDNCVKVLVALCAVEQYADNAFILIREQLLGSPTNQLPMYAEMILPVVTDAHKAVIINTLTSRLGDIEKDTKRKRVEQVIAKMKQGKKK